MNIVNCIIYRPNLSAVFTVTPSLHVCKSSRIFVAFCGEGEFSRHMGTIPIPQTVQSPILVSGVVVVVFVSVSTTNVVAGIAATVVASYTVITTTSTMVVVSSAVDTTTTASVAVTTHISTSIVVSVVVVGVIVGSIVVLIIIPIFIVVILNIVILAPAASTMTVFAIWFSVMRRVLSYELRAHTLHCLNHCRH